MNDMIPLAKDGELNPVRARIIEDIGGLDSEDDYGKGRLTREEGEIIGSLFTESNEAVRSRYFPDQDQLFPKYKTGKAKPVSDEDILDYAIKLLDKAYSNQFETTKTMHVLRAENKRDQEDLISKVDLVKTERNELLDRLNRQEEKRINHIKGLKTQIQNLQDDRDAARKAFDTKEKQAKIQSGQVYYFRAELLRLKEDFTEARKMYEKAVEQDPDNETYQNRLADLEE